MALYRRVVAINTGLLVVAALVLALSPVTVSHHMPLEEWIVLGVGTAFVAAANVLLLRRVFGPLQRLSRLMRAVNPHAPGQRAGIDSAVAEVAGVAEALNEMLDRLERERAESGRRALEAQEAERRRIARELHDEVGQLLTGVVLQLEGIAGRVPETVRVDVLAVQGSARDGVEAVRDIARALRPPALDDFGLRAALTGLANGFAERSGILVRQRLDAPLPELGPEVELALYRVTQEALTNAARHAAPAAIELSIARCNGGVRLCVRDDGRGIAGDAGLDQGAGIAGMRERALLVGGALAIKRGHDGGVEVRFEVPAEVR